MTLARPFVLIAFIAMAPAATQAAPGGRLFLPQDQLPAGQVPSAVAAADFDEDGFADLAVANAASNFVSLLRGAGDGTFAAAGSIPAPPDGHAIVAADLDGDGHADLGVAVASPVCGQVGPCQVLIFHGAGDMTFTSGPDLAVGRSPVAILADDLNGDGALDLAAANKDSADVSVLYGLAAGGFAAAVNLAVGSGPISIGAGYIDNDPYKDLVVANFASEDLSILTGDPLGTFHPERRRSLEGSTPWSLAVGDFNNDTWDDVAIAYPGSDQVSVMLNVADPLGFILLGQETLHAARRAPAAVVAADLDGDGILDLGVANSGADSVSALLGSPAGAFSSGGGFKVGRSPEEITAADLNGDGRADLVTANAQSSDVSVLASR